MQKILVVASTMPAHASDPVPAFVRDQVIALKNAYPDIEFTVLAPHDWRSKTVRFRQHDAYDEYRFHYFWPFHAEQLAGGHGIVPSLKANPLNYLLIPFLFAGEFFALLKLTRRLKPDLLYAHWFTPQGITAGAVSALTRVPFVYTSHSSDVAFLRKVPLLGPAMVRHFSKKARAITVVSRRSLAKLRAFFDDAGWQELQKKVAIIPMGIDLPKATMDKKNKSKAKQIVFVGRLAEKKGVQYLLPAFAKIHAAFPETHLTVAGDGPWRKRLEILAQDLHLQKAVTFAGHVTGQQKSKLITSADVYVVPSIIAESGDAEGLPVSLLEGLAAGNICMATHESGADDILTDGRDGFLIPEKDTAALEAALEKALSLKPQKKRTMQAAARHTAQQFAWPEVAKRHFEHLFKRV